MDIPPTYQEATAEKNKQNWLKRLFTKLFNRVSSTPTPYIPSSRDVLLVERKLVNPFDNIHLSSNDNDSKHTYRSSLILNQSTSTPTTNYVRIKRSNSPIMGVWNIDTSLIVPQELLVPFKDKTEKRHHLHLWSENDRIEATVNVIGLTGDTVLLTASSQGKVLLKVTKPSTRRLSIFCRGSIIAIRIPRTYRGTLKAHSESGSVYFSPGVSQSVRPIYEKGRESRWFIGKMDSNSVPDADGDEDESSVIGGDSIKKERKTKYDVMKLKAKSRTGDKYGQIFVAYEDEDEDKLRIGM